MSSRSKRLHDITCADILDARSGEVLVGLGSGASTSSHLFVYDLALNRMTQKCAFRFTRQTGYPCSIQVAPENKCVVVGTTSGIVLVLDITSLAVITQPMKVANGPVTSLSLCDDIVLATGSALPFVAPPPHSAILSASEKLAPVGDGDSALGSSKTSAASQVSALLGIEHFDDQGSSRNGRPTPPPMPTEVAIKTLRALDTARQQLNTVFSAGPFGGHESMAQLRKSFNLGVNDPLHGFTGLLIRAHTILTPDVMTQSLSLTTRELLAPRLPVLSHLLLSGEELDDENLIDTSDEEDMNEEPEEAHAHSTLETQLNKTQLKNSPSGLSSSLNPKEAPEFHPGQYSQTSSSTSASPLAVVKQSNPEYHPDDFVAMPTIATAPINRFRSDGAIRTRVAALAPLGYLHVSRLDPKTEDPDEVLTGSATTLCILRSGMGATAVSLTTSSSGQLIAIADNSGFVELIGWEDPKAPAPSHSNESTTKTQTSSASSNSLNPENAEEFVPSTSPEGKFANDPYVVNIDSRPTPFASIPRNLLTEEEGGYSQAESNPMPTYIKLDPTCKVHVQIANPKDLSQLGSVPVCSVPFPEPETREELRESVLMQGAYAAGPVEPASLIIPPALHTLTWQPTLAPVDVNLISGLRQQGYLRTAPLSRDGKFIRNHLASTSKYTVPVTALTRGFLAKEASSRSFAELLSSPLRREMTVQPEYARVTVTIPRFGLESFDFSSYNTTPLTGLTNFLPNSYCNALLQAAFYTPVFRRAVMAHTCVRETCVTCELGFLFHLLEGYDAYSTLAERGASPIVDSNIGLESVGTDITTSTVVKKTSNSSYHKKNESNNTRKPTRMRTVEARNFLRMLRSVVHAQTLGLLDPVEPSPELMLAVKSQDFLRFLLACLEKEACDHLRALEDKVNDFEETSQRHGIAHQQSTLSNVSTSTFPPSVFDQHSIALNITKNNFVSSPSDLYELRWVTQFDCSVGRHKWFKANESFSIKLVYPTAKTGAPFSDILKDSLCEEAARRVWCEPCNSFQQLNMRRLLTSLPNVLCIACNIDTDAELDLWRVAPPSIRVSNVVPITLFGQKDEKSKFNESKITESNETPEPKSTPTESEEKNDAQFMNQIGDTIDPKAVPPPSHHKCFFPSSPFEAVGPDFQQDLETNTWSWLPLAIQVIVSPPCESPLPTSACNFLNTLNSTNQNRKKSPTDLHSMWNSSGQHVHSEGKSPMSQDPLTNIIKQDPEFEKVLASGCNVKIKRIDSKQQLNELLEESYENLKRDFEAARENAKTNVSKNGQKPSLTAQPVIGSSYWSAIYRLGTVISHISDPPEKNSPLNTVNGEHLITHSLVSARDLRFYRNAKSWKVASGMEFEEEVQEEEGLDPKELENSRPGWYAFNDFVVTKSAAREAVNFSHLWKLPCAVQFFRIDAVAAHHARLINYRLAPLQVLRRLRVNNFLYVEALRLNTRRPHANRYVKLFEPLTPNEPVERGHRFAIDCEFVAVDLEERASDGRVTRPARLALARVSVVRGSGPKKGTPLLDYYIRRTEKVADYLTRYSGISSGDLDVNTSTHHLTTLKAVYLSLYALAARGAVFVGHGLQKDFQMLNLCVPSEQILDTVTLFSTQGRLLSLKFLAAHVLDRTIQGTTHDSLEDSLTALELLDKYEELQRSGEFDAKVEELYDIGRATNFRV